MTSMKSIDLAKAYYNGDDEKHIKEDLDMCEYYLQKSLEEDNKNPEIFYYFGLLYSDNDEFEDLAKAVLNFKKSYNLGNKESALNLAYLFEFSLEDSIENKVEAVKWYLAYGNSYFQDCVPRLASEIYKNIDNSIESLRYGISTFKDFCNRTQNKELRSLFYKKIDNLIEKFINVRCDNLQGLDEIQCAINDLEKYKNNPFIKNKVKSLIKERNYILTNKINTVSDALILLDKKDEFNFEEPELNSIFRFIIFSYLNGTNGVSFDFNKAITYKRQYIGATHFLDEFLVGKVNGFIKELRFETAKVYCSHIFSDDKKTFCTNKIKEEENMYKFKEANEKAKSGDVISLLNLTKMYECGIGCTRDTRKAFDNYAEIFKNTLNISALEGAVRCYKDNVEGFEPVVIELFRFAEKNNLSIPPSLIESKYYFLSRIMLYKDEKYYFQDLSNYRSFAFEDVSDEHIRKLAQELTKRKITKLIHFTSKENVDSIMKYGILSRVEIFKNNSIYRFRINDLERRERNLNAVCVSITIPNTYMLENKMKEYVLRNPYIIEIDANMLLDKKMRFIYCSGNAATIFKKTINKGPHLDDFKEMFKEDYESWDGSILNRTCLCRRDNEPTDIQSEILVEGYVPKEYFIGKPIPWDEWKRKNKIW